MTIQELVEHLGDMHAIDRAHCEDLEIIISDDADGTRVWVHCDGKLVGRFYRIGKLHMDDRRKAIAAVAI